MKGLFLLFLSSTIVISTCNHKDQSLELPACIRLKIESLQKAAVQNPPVITTSYMYRGQTVYHFNAPCCDQFSSLYDENCLLICHPAGGITGNGDGKCTDFMSVATEKNVLWQDTRSAN